MQFPSYTIPGTSKMGDFDWYGTAAAVHAVSHQPPCCATLPPRRSSTDLSSPLDPFTSQAGASEAIIAGDTQGNIFSSYPLDETGNYKFWVSRPEAPRAPRHAAQEGACSPTRRVGLEGFKRALFADATPRPPAPPGVRFSLTMI